MTRTDEQIVEQANGLARRFAALDGYAYATSHRFSERRTARDARYWNLAAIAFEELEATPIDDALSAIGECP